MLGLARASQLAGWGAGGPPKAAFASLTSAETVENYQRPSFSILGGYTLPDITINNTGNYDLTGYTSLSGYNNQKSTQMMTVYLTWPTSGIATSDYVAVNPNNEFKLTGGTWYYNPTIRLTNSNTNLALTVGTPGAGSTLTLPGSYTQYVNRWLTCIWSTSNTAADFTSSTHGLGSGAYARTTCYDTVTGERLGLVDYRINFSPYPDLSTAPNTFPAGSNFGANTQYLFTNVFGSGSEAQPYQFRMANWWFAIGTMWDPLSASDTSWRTTRPSRDIGTSRAWYNLQMTDYVELGSPAEKYIKTQGMDIYSQADNKITQTANNAGYSSAQWTTVYSDSIYTSARG